MKNVNILIYCVSRSISHLTRISSRLYHTARQGGRIWVGGGMGMHFVSMPRQFFSISGDNQLLTANSVD